MKYKAILFDMDGTLVPMDVNVFTNGYFKGLTKKLAPHGVPADLLVKGVWAGTKAMVANDGAKLNEDVFWEVFEKLIGKGKEEMNEDCLSFYGNEFNEAICFTSPNPLAKEAVGLARQKAEKVVLATNPFFPMVGQCTRMGWVGLKQEDFDLVTAYETDRYCKPNPKYYLSVCERIGVKPEECLMIGNDETEDMYSASSIGMDTYLVTEWSISSEKHPYMGERGTFAELVEKLKNL